MSLRLEFFSLALTIPEHFSFSMKKFFSALLLGMVLFPVMTFAHAAAKLYFYYGATCPHCHEEMKWFPELEKMYPGVRIEKYEVWFDAKNKVLLEERMKELGENPQGVPVNVIGEKVIVGFLPEEILKAFA